MILDDVEGNYLRHRENGRTLPFRKKHGVYMIDVELHPVCDDGRVVPYLALREGDLPGDVEPPEGGVGRALAVPYCPPSRGGACPWSHRACTVSGMV